MMARECALNDWLCLELIYSADLVGVGHFQTHQVAGDAEFFADAVAAHHFWASPAVPALVCRCEALQQLAR